MRQAEQPKEKSEGGIESFLNKNATLDTTMLRTGKPSADIENEVANYFSMRNFIFSLVYSSPITVKEKLDILYDISSYCNKFVDGIDFKSAVMIFNSVLRHHQVYMPFNELYNQTEKIFNQGVVCGIVSVFWSRKLGS